MFKKVHTLRDWFVDDIISGRKRFEVRDLVRRCFALTDGGAGERMKGEEG